MGLTLAIFLFIRKVSNMSENKDFDLCLLRNETIYNSKTQANIALKQVTRERDGTPVIARYYKDNDKSEIGTLFAVVNEIDSKRHIDIINTEGGDGDPSQTSEHAYEFLPITEDMMFDIDWLMANTNRGSALVLNKTSEAHNITIRGDHYQATTVNGTEEIIEASSSTISLRPNYASLITITRYNNNNEPYVYAISYSSYQIQYTNRFYWRGGESLTYFLNYKTNIGPLYTSPAVVNVALTSVRQMFFNCKDIIEIDLSDFDTSNAKAAQHMFANCESLEILDLSDCDFTNVGTKTGNMFTNCNSLTSVKVSGCNSTTITKITNALNTASAGGSNSWHIDDTNEYLMP